MGELGVFRLERPGDERRKSTGFVLKIAQALKVTDPVMNGFTDANHHRGRRAKTKRMGRAMNHQPLIGFAFQWADGFTDFIIQNLAAATRHRIQSRSFQPRENVGDR